MFDHLRLLLLQVEALYVHNQDDKIITSNEPDPIEDIPLFLLSRSSLGNIWRYRVDLPQKAVIELEKIARTEAILVDLLQSPLHKDRYLQIISEYCGAVEIDFGISYYFQNLPPSKNTITINSANSSLLEKNFPYTLKMIDKFSPVVAIVREGSAVSICRSVRNTQFVAEAGVDTIPEYRGKGFASENVRNWIAQVYASDKIPLYSTTYDNLASKMVAKKLNAVEYGSSFSVLERSK